METWRPVTGYEGSYEVSDLGNVRGLDRMHRLVLAAFAGPPTEGQEARHLNGVQTDNRLSNLAWGTRAENIADQLAHGTHRNASKTHCPSGHPYDDENTYVYAGAPHRTCRACRSEHARNHKQKKAVA